MERQRCYRRGANRGSVSDVSRALIGPALSRVVELDRNPLSASLCAAVLGRVVWRRSAAGRGRAVTGASSVADENVVVSPTAFGRVVGMKLG